MDYKIVLMKDAEEDFESLNQLTDCILKKERYIKRCSTEHLFISVLEKERHI
jgi:predicted alpha/beta superfamily hydrolase